MLSVFIFYPEPFPAKALLYEARAWKINFFIPRIMYNFTTYKIKL